MPASLRLSRHGDNETSQVPGPPAPHLPCSRTPTGPCQAVSARRCCPRSFDDEDPNKGRASGKPDLPPSNVWVTDQVPTIDNIVQLAEADYAA